MKSRFTYLLLAIVATVAVVAAVSAAEQNDAARTLLEAARKAEVVDGDLNAAIQQYKNIADRFKTDHAIAATALLRMAQCYEKLGDAQARAIYEQVVREYPDQSDALMLARVRLGRGERTDAPRALTLRRVWSSDVAQIAGARGDTQYAISSDGRYLTYVDNYNTALVLRDLATGADRRLTTGGYPGPSPWGGIYRSAISRDGAQVAFNSCTQNQTTCDVRVASLKGTGVPVSRRVFGGGDISYIAPMDWSPDGKWLAVSVQRTDRTAQIGLVSVEDGALRVLKSVEWRGPAGVFFSPDGRDLAFDLPVNETSTERDVFVLATDGSREVAAVAHPGNDIVIAWTPDGTRLLFASDRGGARGLWAQAFKERNPHGAPKLVKPDIGMVSPLGITRSGDLYLGVRARNEDVELASVDLTTGRQTAPTVRLIQRSTGDTSQPNWSPDGKSLAYVSDRGEKDTVAVLSADTGDIREIPVPGLAYFAGLSWAPDGRAFVARGADLKGRNGVFRIDPRSGEVVPIFFNPPRPSSEYPTAEGFFWSRDGKRMYYHGNLGSIYERDLVSGHERVLVSAPTPTDGTLTPDGKLGPISLSPDGRWIASGRLDRSTKSTTVVLIPVDGGTPRELLRVSLPESVLGNGSMSWTPDGLGLLVKKGTSADPQLWFVPMSGASPRQIDLQLTEFGTVRMHPDGKQIAFDSRRFSSEVWVLENFLPALNAKNSAAKQR